MGQTRKRHTSEFKRKVAIEAIKGDKTTNQITSEYGIHTTQVKQWMRKEKAKHCFALTQDESCA